MPKQSKQRKRRDYKTGAVYQRCEARYGCPAVGSGPPDPDTGKPTRAVHRCKGRWFASIEAGWTGSGARRRVTVSAKTEAAVKVKLREKVRQREEHGDSKVDSRTTVKAWAEQWLDIVVYELSPNAFNASRSAVTKWVVPTIGHRRLAELAPADVRKVIATQRAAGLAESTRLRTHSVLMQLLKAARQEGHPVPVSVTEVKPPGKGVSDRTDMAVEEAVKVLTLAAGKPDGSRIVGALLQGLRQGEALGLTRDALDFDAGLIVLSWQLQPLPYRHGCVPDLRTAPTCGKKAAGCPLRAFRVPDGYESRQVRGRLHLVRPKSSAGWRVVPMVTWFRAAAEAWLEVAPPAPHGLVWYHPKGDPAKLDDAAWYALQEAAGVHHPTRLREDGRPAPYTIHETRHTTATLLLEAGVSPEVIIAILGHASILSSRSYLHVKTAPLREALEKVSDRLAISPPADAP